MGQKAIWKGTDTQYITAYLEGASPFTYNTPLPFATRDCYMCWLRLLCESQHMEAGEHATNNNADGGASEMAAKP